MTHDEVLTGLEGIRNYCRLEASAVGAKSPHWAVYEQALDAAIALLSQPTNERDDLDRALRLGYHKLAGTEEEI